jgi:glycosyltransferase involved in cell wall biosynthesis
MQTYQNWELLLIDDGSNDRTLEVVSEIKDPRIRVIVDGQHRLLPARLNQIIEMASGQFFARMDGDDIAYPRRLEQQLTFMNSHPELDLIGAWILVFGSEGAPIGKRAGTISHTWRYTTMLQSIPLAHPTFMGKTDWFRRNRYPEWSSHCQDQQLLLSSIGNSKFGVLPEILLGYREEDLSLGKQFRYRRSFAETFDSLKTHRGGITAVFAVAIQCCKFCLDSLAIVTGLRYRLLRTRARPLTEQEQLEWRDVWMQVVR